MVLIDDHLLRWADDADLEPHAVLRALRDDHGAIVDFSYRAINDIACRQHQRPREDLLNRSVAETLSEVQRRGLLATFAQCVDTGRPAVLTDFVYHGKATPGSTPDSAAPQPRHYEVQVVPLPEDCVSLRWRDVTDRVEALAAAEQARDLQRISADALLDPQVFLEVIPDRSGRPLDLVFREVNLALCDYLGKQRSEVIGHRLTDVFPGVVGGVLAQYLDSALAGEPVMVDDFGYFNEVLGVQRSYDIRGRQVRPGLFSVTFRDVTERSEAARRLAASEEHYRLLAFNSTDAVLHVRDGIVVWVAPAIERVLGAPPQHWIGTPIGDVVPPEDIPAFEERWAILNGGGEVQQRVRVVSVDGITHWVHLHAKPFYNAEGHRDGVSAALRLIDDEVAAEAQLAEARARETRAEALYRRSVESTTVGTCLASPHGAFLEVNKAMCRFFGYDAETLLTMSWIDLNAPDGLDLSPLEEMLAGRVDSYQIKQQKFLHSTGRPVWGDLYVGCLRDENGNVDTLFGQIVDVTDEVHSREQLAASEERYRLMTQNAGDAITHIRDGKFLWVSPAIQNVLGAPPEHWIGRDVSEIIPPEDTVGYRERMAILEAGGSILAAHPTERSGRPHTLG